MRITNRVEMLELAANITGQVNKVHPVLLTDDDEVVLIDTGYPGQLGLLQEKLVEADSNCESITKIYHDPS